MKKKYLQRRLQDTEKLKEALHCKNSNVFRDVAHKLKGSARLFGHIDLEKLGLVIEEHSRLNDWSALQRDLEELVKWCRKRINLYSSP